MANLIPTPGLDDVYQIETTDRVLGGPGGVANTPAQQLLNRSAYIAQYTALPFRPGASYALDQRVRLDSGDIVRSTVEGNTSDPNSDMTGWVKTNAADQLNATVIYAEGYGLSDSEDNTPVFDKIIQDAQDGAKIIFPYNMSLLGHFISEEKSLSVDFNGCTLTNTLDDEPLIQIGSFNVDEYDVTEVVLNYGDTQFTVVGASTAFNVGDIGYLWDGAKRSDGHDVNFEVIKIKFIAGDSVTVEGFLASFKGASSIKFLHSSAQLKNAKIENANLAPTSSHTALVSLLANIENPILKNNASSGTTGVAFAIRYCYGGESLGIKPSSAAAFSSGQGYGLALYGVSQHEVDSVSGSGMRHMYDQDSVYFIRIRNITDMDDKSAPVALAHNGFAGHITLDGVNCVTSQYPVSLSEQGYGGTVPALKQNHPFRHIHVKNVNARIRDDVDPSTNTGVYGVYFQNSTVGCTVDGVEVTVLNPNAMTPTSGSSLVRVNGVVNKGLVLSNLKANKIGRVFSATGGTRSGFAYDNSKTVIRNISVGDCSQVYLAQGLYYVDVDSLGLGLAPKSLKIGVMTVSGSDQPFGAYHGTDIDYVGQGVAQLDCNATNAIAGALPKGVKTAAAGITLIDGQSITINELQEKSSWLRLNPPMGAGSITVAMPKPQTIGDEVLLSNPANRFAVVLSGTNMNANVTVNPTEIVTLRVVGSKWSLVSRVNNV